MDETSPGTDTVSKDLYIKHGYRSRAHYLKELADQYCVPLQLVHRLAMLLGPSEDFDGLILALEDDI